MIEEQPGQFSPYEARLKLQWINHLLDSDPHNPALWFMKAVYFEQAIVDTDHKKAFLEHVLLWYQQCMREEAGNWACYHNYAAILSQLNRYEEALSYIREAVRLNPSSDLAQTLLIQTLIRMGLWHEAIDEFKEAIGHGCALDSSIFGRGLADMQEAIGRRASDSPDIPDIFVFEAADPELFTLQVEVEELMRLGLTRAAEELCIHFEVEHGTNNLIRSYFSRMRAQDSVESEPAEVTISASYPLLEIARQHLGFEYRGIVNQIFKAGGVGWFITPKDVDDFDNQVRWFLELLKKPDFNINDPLSAVKPIDPHLDRIWSMAALNFIVAHKLNHPILITYTATTLANFYARLGKSRLPFILYNIAALSAEQAEQANSCANAHGKCAEILMEKNEFCAAANHLERALRYEERMSPSNRVDLYLSLIECFNQMADFDKAKAYASKAVVIKEVSEELQKTAQAALWYMEIRAKDSLGPSVMVSLPVRCEGLEAQSFVVFTPNGFLMLQVTSKHELYDSLLLEVDKIYRVRRSLREREVGYNYFQRHVGLMDELVRTALDLELPANALMHLEAQKSIILHNRLRYLMRDKPPGLPDVLWQELEQLVRLHRRMVETVSGTETGLEVFADFTLLDVENAIRAKLWECSQVSDVGARQIRRKLAFGKFPPEIECHKPQQTLILEFCPGACFLIRPDNPQNPEAIELPEATPEESERLVHEFFGILQEWLDHFSHTASLATYPLTTRFDAFMARFNDIFYRPIAEKLDEMMLTNVCIIPHRVLHVLPLNLLGLTAHPQGSLAERFEVSFAPSLASLESFGAQPVRPPEQFLIVSNPVPYCPAIGCRNPNHDCFSIDGAERESRMLASRVKNLGFSTAYLHGKEATVKTVAAALGSADIVHFATHGFFDDAQPEYSGVLLSMPKDGGGKGSQYLLHNCTVAYTSNPTAVGELLTLDYIWKNIDMFHCRVVNLSACSSGMVDWSERSDEFYGMANGFIYAGAENIITSLWPVHDVVSEMFNLLFYEELLGSRHPTITAFKTTLERLKKIETEGIRPFSHPLFWAGYRVIGFS